ATFTVTAEAADADEGGVLSYWWQLSMDGGNTWGNIPGARNASYTTPAVIFDSNAYLYRCIITNTKNGVTSNPVYSDTATLYVVAAPSITGHPQDITVAADTTA